MTRTMRSPLPWLSVALVATVLAAPAQASQVEDTIGGGFHYQHDGNADGDASDHCSMPSPTIRASDGEVGGILVPVDDLVDHYGYEVGSADVGKTHTITITGSLVPHLNMPGWVGIGAGTLASCLWEGTVTQGMTQIVLELAPQSARTYVLELHLEQERLPEPVPPTLCRDLVCPQQCDPACRTPMRTIGYQLTFEVS